MPNMRSVQLYVAGYVLVQLHLCHGENFPLYNEARHVALVLWEGTFPVSSNFLWTQYYWAIFNQIGHFPGGVIVWQSQPLPLSLLGLVVVSSLCLVTWLSQCGSCCTVLTVPVQRVMLYVPSNTPRSSTKNTSSNAPWEPSATSDFFYPSSFWSWTVTWTVFQLPRPK